MVRRRALGAVTSWLFSLALAGCGGGAVPSPREAASAFARAAERGDAAALHAMLSSASQRSRSEDDVRRLLSAGRVELAEYARAVARDGVRAEGVAKLRYEDGEEVSLALDGERFRVTGAGTLPGGARSPTEALDQLRRALARRSYAALLRVVTPTTRAAIEADLRTLVEGLEHPHTLAVQSAGDTAQVTVPGGHRVRLKRDGDVWRVDDFD